jgi:hypothetical protein
MLDTPIVPPGHKTGGPGTLGRWVTGPPGTRRMLDAPRFTEARRALLKRAALY